MKKRVTDLTKDEIAKLFPVELYPYDSKWNDIYLAEEKLLLKTLGGEILRIEHFGSTSIPNIIAKDTIDILIAISADDNFSTEIIEGLKSIDYDYILQKEGDSEHMIFVKGYNSTGEKDQTFHIHMAPATHIIWDRIYFRDYLTENPHIAKKYEDLKKQLSAHHKYDRVGYRIAKGEFVYRITQEAKQFYSAC